MKLRKTNGTFTSEEKEMRELKIKVLFVTLSAITIGVLMSAMIIRINDWSAKNVIRTQAPIVVRKPIWVEDRPEPIVLSPMVKQVETLDVDSPVEQKILDIWGERYFLLMTSIFKCESGLRADAVNWSSKDLGVAQINWPIWEKKVGEKFGYTLGDMFDVDKNLEVAYWIWDRADGTEGDGKGSAEPWVVYNNGTFRGCVE